MNCSDERTERFCVPYPEVLTIRDVEMVCRLFGAYAVRGDGKFKGFERSEGGNDHTA